MQHWNHISDEVHSYCAVSKRKASVCLHSQAKRICFVLLAVFFPAFASAQHSDGNEAESEEKIGVVRKAPTEIILLRDKNGNLVKVATNLSLEEYLRIYNQQNDVEDDNTPPDFTLDQAIYAGLATETHLGFTAEFRVQLIQPA